VPCPSSTPNYIHTHGWSCGPYTGWAQWALALTETQWVPILGFTEALWVMSWLV